MLKTKEDNFLGDNITHNIQYADNEWQAHGTVDRDSVYTKESLLSLLFEEKDYDPDLGTYKDYIPRGSTKNAFSKNYVGARLQHDIVLLDTLFYSSSPITSAINIFDIDTYLKKAIAISNPVFDDKARVDVIQMVDINSCGDLKLKEFFDALDPDGAGDVIRKKFLYERYGLEVVNSKNDPGDVTLKELWVDPKFDRETFQKDFQLHLHNPDTIKMPFNVRGEDSDSDIKTYETRFISNSFTKKILDNNRLTQKRIEFMNDIIEEAIFSNEFQQSFNLSTGVFEESFENFKNVQNTINPATGNKYTVEEWLRERGYGHIIDKYVVAQIAEDSSEKTSIQEILESVFKHKANINNYCPEVYAGFNESVNFKESYGIHLMTEEDTANIFQDEDKSYRLFNEVVIGYKLVDCLLSARTFLGGTQYLINSGITYKNQTSGEALEVNYTKNIPLYSIPKFSYINEGSSDSYKTIDILNNVYKLGHGIKDKGLAPEIKAWLENECFIFKAPVYGDYVEELNFMQDLNPDSDVQFKNIRVKKTELPYRRLQDSKVEVPYVEQTPPLLNNTPENEKGIGVYASDALAGVGNRMGSDGNTNVFPPFSYDFDKGDEESKILSADGRSKDLLNGAQRVNSKSGGMVVEDRLISPTIDEIWTFLKYLTESDGKFKGSKDRESNKNINERLPSFFGVSKNSVLNSLFSTIEGSDKSGIKNTVNPLVSEEELSYNSKQIDILNWEPTAKALPVHFSSQAHPELQFGGFTVTRYIEKIYDYKVNIFGRRLKDTEGVNHTRDLGDKQVALWDGTKYEYNTEELDNYNNTTGYLEKLFNSAILGFAIENMDDGDPLNGRKWNVVDSKVLLTDELDNNLVAAEMFTSDNDKKLLTKNSPVESSIERKKAFDHISKILTWHGATDGETAVEDGLDTSYHNHYKKYLEQPKNLKEIERDLETIRQNIQAFVEFYVAQSVSKGYNDRSYNRGTLHELHRNHFSYDSTLLRMRPGDLDEESVAINLNNVSPEVGEVLVKLMSLSNTLNNLKDDLTVNVMDKKVVFEDGQFDKRYQRENYDRHVIDLSDPILNERHPHEMYRPNETLLSEVYMAADGTWRSIHEHGVVPIVYDDM